MPAEAPIPSGAHEGGLRPLDISKPKELWSPNFALLSISGLAGTGKSTLAKGLATELSIPVNQVFRAGDALRELEGVTERAPGFITRDEAIDQVIDTKVSQMVREASIDKPSIVEARIGGATVTHTIQLMKEEGVFRGADIPIVRILLHTAQSERMRRLVDDAMKKEENVDPEEIRNKTLEREKKDLEHWRKMYDWIGKGNPLSRGARDAEGNIIYAMEIDNTHYNAEQTIQDVVNQLVLLGRLIRRPTIYPRFAQT